MVRILALLVSLATLPLMMQKVDTIGHGKLRLVLALIGIVWSMATIFFLSIQMSVARLPPQLDVERLCRWEVLSFGELLERGACRSPSAAASEVRGAEGCDERAPAVSPASSSSAVRDTVATAGGCKGVNSSCPCCLAEFAAEDTVAVPHCGHVFCAPCLDRWANSGAPGAMGCPICRCSYRVRGP